MNTVMLWLLLSVGGGPYAGTPTQVVERFASEAECMRVAKILYDSRPSSPVVRCIQASILAKAAL